MGANKSTPESGKVESKDAGDHSPLPEDAQSYQGSSLECLSVSVPVQMTRHFVSGFSAGKTALTSDLDSYYPTITGYFEQGYTLNTFYRVPGVVVQAGFRQMQIPFEALYSRPVGITSCEDSKQLLIEKSTINVQQSGIGIQSRPHETVANSSVIMNKIMQHSSVGGRLICVEVNGLVTTQGIFERGVGVDVFFEIPSQPTPAKYVYQAINVPISYTLKRGFRPKPTLDCDWLGTLATYLNQGWKLVEIILDRFEQQNGAFTMSASINSVWIFEKESHKLQDPTPVFEGAVLEYFHKVARGLRGISVKSDWTPVIAEMGRRGWELACIQETPEFYRYGFAKFEIKLIMFFQRRIVAGEAMTPPAPPPPYPGPPSSTNPLDHILTDPSPPDQPAEKLDPPC
ncbi:uncharacterized protein LOC114517323 [Dendronephthya gigantea]|uniref:uncharacterized protein LOC114517323 n=1 Tax=Dendronephthya gigantea TaxID=151771 RepID=UPI0010698670|nr:uncharacterized protein LOC114517323 [Dendronephthya gigantea]